MGTEDSNAEAGFNNYLERCDRCIARGQEKVEKNDLELFFCRHHFAAHEAALLADGWVVFDPSSVEEEPKEPALV